MLLAALAVGEETGAFERQLDAVGLVRQLRRVLLGGDVDALAVDDDVVAVRRDLSREFPMNAVAAEQPGIRLGVGEIVDRHELQPAIGPLEDRPGDQPTDSAEAVDCNFRHWIPRSFMNSSTRPATMSGVRPKNSNASPAGAETPKRSMPILRP